MSCETPASPLLFESALSGPGIFCNDVDVAVFKSLNLTSTITSSDTRPSLIPNNNENYSHHITNRRIDGHRSPRPNSSTDAKHSSNNLRPVQSARRARTPKKKPRSRHSAESGGGLSGHTAPGDSVEPPSEPDPVNHERAINRMIESVRVYFPTLGLPPDRVRVIESFVDEAYKAASLDYNVDQAIEWGDGFVFPPEATTRDGEALVAMDMDLTGLIRKHQQELLPLRFNLSRLEGRDPSHPDTARLRDIAEHGVRIPVAPDFVEDRVPPKMDRTYVRAHSAVDKMWYSLYLAGFVLLIPTSLLAAIPATVKLNYSPPGWARKRGKKKGRPISDHSRKNRFGHALNTKWCKAAVKALYGEIAPVQIDELMIMIIEQADRVGWDNLVLWKMDLKGAFNLVFFNPEEAGLLAMELSGGLTIISLVGTFGHQATPFAFDVLSRTLLADVRSRIHGDSKICCDDLMGACAIWEREEDLATARACIESFFGPDSVAEDKTELGTDNLGRHIDFIGWYVDLDEARLGIARHNVLKVFYGFCEMRNRHHLAVREIMKLASWSTRYSLVCRWMRPLTSFLYSSSVGYSNLDAQVPVSDDMRVILDLWIMFLILMELDPPKFTRGISTFTSTTPSLHINLDASLTGLGLIISRITEARLADGNELELKTTESQVGDWIIDVNKMTRTTVAVVEYAHGFLLGDDSSFQNSVEFVAIVTSLLLVTSLGLGKEGVIIQGDSTTALSWTAKEKFRAGRSTGAAICYMQLQQGSGEVPISGTDHIAGAINPSDPLSRGVHPSKLGYPPWVILNLRDNPSLHELINGMDPTISLNLQSDLGARWKHNQEMLDILQSDNGGWLPSSTNNLLTPP